MMTQGADLCRRLLMRQGGSEGAGSGEWGSDMLIEHITTTKIENCYFLV